MTPIFFWQLFIWFLHRKKKANKILKKVGNIILFCGYTLMPFQELSTALKKLLSLPRYVAKQGYTCSFFGYFYRIGKYRVKSAFSKPKKWNNFWPDHPKYGHFWPSYRQKWSKNPLETFLGSKPLNVKNLAKNRSKTWK